MSTARSESKILLTGATAYVGGRLLRELEVEAGCLWSELGLEPLHTSIVTGIPAALDECVAYRWLHPVEDSTGW